ncbi:cytosolic Fe-S cluster assembly factor NBP35, putative [Plasmodium vivax]|uniref:Cytosolic Fe-S cluster assembly factor NBP35, putative n=2 Tax=Plasmodium vivax TaxID=5855 RepID=A0A1G4HAC8_PLAVI|nr:nucleotide-binding protein 1 [Plasmodium vivax North Korean]SCO71863.1 cytosolic Fe-S cluster assembly factor NBP35, putative [Plasmodium vivax]
MYAYTRRNAIPILIGSLAGLTISYLFANRREVRKCLACTVGRAIAKWKMRKCARHPEDGKNPRSSDEQGGKRGGRDEPGDGRDIPEECPGMENEQAGKSKVCEGCPNRKICNDPELKKEKEKEKNQIFNQVQENLKNVKYKILVLSGKGGVGKSTVATQLAFSLSYLNYDVGLLDIDICGPSVPVLTQTVSSDVNYSMNGWVPIYKNNLSIMSVGYLLPNFDDPVIWRGPKKNGLIKQFLCDVYWKSLDFLIIDTPPGTSDEHLTICSYLKNNLNGCIIVTTPHILSICDVKKEIEFCKKTNIPILGVVENMYQSVFVSKYTVDKMCAEMNVDYAGKITFDQKLIDACQHGVGCCDLDVRSSSSKEVFQLCKFFVQKILQNCLQVPDPSGESAQLAPSANVGSCHDGEETLQQNGKPDQENSEQVQMLRQLLNQISQLVEEDPQNE